MNKNKINNEPNVCGYYRNDTDLLRNEIKALRHENRRLVHDNLDMKEGIDILQVKCEDQNEHIHSLQLELNYKLKEREHSSVLAEKHYGMELRACDERLRQSVEEVHALKKRVGEADARCAKLANERLKFVELTEKLTEENKRLYKKWFRVRTNESKFRSSLVEQMNRRSAGLNGGKRRACGGKEKGGGGFLMGLVTDESVTDGSLNSSGVSGDEEACESSKCF